MELLEISAFVPPSVPWVTHSHDVVEKVTGILTFIVLSIGLFKVAVPSKPLVAGVLEQDLQVKVPLQENDKQGS